MNKKSGKSIKKSRFKQAPVADPFRDSVTGLYSLELLRQRIKEVMAKSNRSHEKWALILWDIDGFISFNNKFGRSSGDLLLKKVGESIRASLREYDEAFRGETDEFYAIVQPSSPESAQQIISRVSDTVSRNLFDKNTEYADHSFSLSAGVVFYPGENSIPEALIHAAHQDMYAKQRDLKSKNIK
ncbi:MAG: GGDEF domain-containing protein [Elusimicrobiota bacterium]